MGDVELADEVALSPCRDVPRGSLAGIFVDLIDELRDDVAVLVGAEVVLSQTIEARHEDHWELQTLRLVNGHHLDMPLWAGVVRVLRIVQSRRLEVPAERPVEVAQEPDGHRLVLVVGGRDELAVPG